MEGTNQLLIKFHQQLETVREEIRREMAERMALLQWENDVLRSQVQFAVSIASNSRPNRRTDLMNAATRLDLGVSPPSIFHSYFFGFSSIFFVRIDRVSADAGDIANPTKEEGSSPAKSRINGPFRRDKHNSKLGAKE
ncbi:unnamed protein product [Cuscuta epithymum]|uniref:Uncharacterized protein n=1 Tax=Cuscuta epithymum TaxID=186058 RepID=A0AAV0C4U9_9ASTE|nr:unnamed protein product [Cuscuta epithymum]